MYTFNIKSSIALTRTLVLIGIFVKSYDSADHISSFKYINPLGFNSDVVMPIWFKILKLYRFFCFSDFLIS